MEMHKQDLDYQCLLQTLYASFPLASPAFHMCVAWVIKNRASCNRPEWGGYTIIGVCRTFPCWNGRRGLAIPMHNTTLRNSIESWLPTIYKIRDPTYRAVMYHNPVSPIAARSPRPSETEYIQSKKVGYWIFYKLRDSSAR